MARPKINIQRIEDADNIYFVREKDGFALVFNKKAKTISGYNFSPSEKVLQGMGISAATFFKISLPLITAKLRKPPSPEKVKQLFRELDVKYRETYK
jgi:hypothetical protein